MRLAKYVDPAGTTVVGSLQGDRVVALRTKGNDRPSLTELLELGDEAWRSEVVECNESALPLSQVTLLAPIDAQEVWAAGVTYLRSKTAREAESEGAARFYDLVYSADRPELFFKATAHRVSGPGGPIRVRRDSRWTVPEPELALVLTADLRLVGVTLGNDVSARDIEGANPLYLPQAKLYREGCALGPWIRRLGPGFDLAGLTIQMEIRRDDRTIFDGITPFSRMIRPIDSLIDYLGRDNQFPAGVVLLTGTGIVPPDDLSLAPGDQVSIHCEAIGTLTNVVVQGD
ncbi:MAG: 2-hydroxyhepta-2,4-diene-1,7-dioate isomerase [Isosphaeraceae bacterium]|jgi:2-dehydro-3-deoxy-D-arabinonate dehydratase|nr:MAG: 2-hydroxyhepta-2,4-diene-1,7-dioate isomerase [Isosphaeraceae bacterium]